MTWKNYKANVKYGEAGQPLECAIVEYESTTQGVLYPRLTTVERNLISNPVSGLVIYNSDALSLEIYDDVAVTWGPLGGGGISEWTASTDYNNKDIVWEQERLYKALSTHTSGATFVGDAAQWVEMSRQLIDTEIEALYEGLANTNKYTDAEKSKLAGIEDNATQDQTATEIETLYEGIADTNKYTDAEKSKLAGIEANATEDQTDAEIKTAYENNADTNAFTDADESKLDGIEDNATQDQTATEIETLYEGIADTNKYTDAEKLLVADAVQRTGDTMSGDLNFGTGGKISDSVFFEVEGIGKTAYFQSDTKVVLKTVSDGLNSGDIYIDTDAAPSDTGDVNIFTGTSTAGTKGKVKISDVIDPTADDHAANKKYIDDSLQPLLDIQADTNEPSGFIRDNTLTMGILELSPDGTIIHRIDQDKNFTTSMVGHPNYDAGITAGQFYDGTVAAARQFAISPVTGNDLEFYVEGTKYTKTTTTIIDLANVTGTQYMYFDATGTLTSSTIFDDVYIKSSALVSIVYGNAATQELIDWADERHGVQMDGFTHLYLHNTEGARYASGMDIGGLADGGTTHGSIGSGVLWDEDIISEPNIQANAPFWYLEGTAWRILPDGSDLGHIVSGDTRISYNEDVGGTFQLTELSNNEATIMFIVATNHAVYPYVKVIGQSVYPRVTDAQNAIGDELSKLTTTGLPTPEFIFVGAIILNDNGELQLLDDGSTYLDLRTIKNVSAGGASAAIVDHRVTTNRDAIASHPATAITYDPTVAGVIDPAIVDVQSAIDAAAAMGGVGSPSLYLLLDADNIGSADFTDTNNILTDDETETDNVKYLLTNTAGSTGYEASYSTTLFSDAKTRRTHICKLYNSVYTGTKGNVTLVIKDQAANVLGTMTIDPNANAQELTFAVPSTVTSIVAVPTIVTGEVATWTFDKIALDYSPFGEASLEKKETITYSGYTSLNASSYALFKTELSNSGSKLVTTDGHTDHTRYTFINKACFTATFNKNGSANAPEFRWYSSDNVLKANGIEDSTSGVGSMAHTGEAEIGDYLVAYSTNALADGTYTNFSVTASATQDYVTVEGNKEQGHFVGKAVYNLSAVYSTTSTSYILPSLSLTSSSTSGNLVQNTANAPSLTIPNAKTGTYKVTLTGSWGDGGTERHFLALYDGTTYISEQINYAAFTNSASFVYENTTNGDINLDIYMKTTAGTMYFIDAVPLELSVTYLPPADQATVQTLNALPVRAINDFDVDASSAGVLSNFNGASDWCSLVSHTAASGVYVYVLNTSIFTALPLIGAIASLTTVNVTVVYSGTDTFTLTFTGHTGVGTDTSHQITAKKRGADRDDDGLFLGNCPKVVHSNNEFYTGEDYIDGRKIYARSFSWTGSTSATFNIATVETGLSILKLEGTAGTGSLWYSSNLSSNFYLSYDDASGNFVFNDVGASVWTRLFATITYVK